MSKSTHIYLNLLMYPLSFPMKPY